MTKYFFKPILAAGLFIVGSGTACAECYKMSSFAFGLSAFLLVVSWCEQIEELK